MPTSGTQLLEQGQTLARELRREGRRRDAQTVDALLQVAQSSDNEMAPYLTTGEVAQRVGVSRQTVVNWVKKGLLPGVRLGGRTLVAPAALQRFAQLEGILNALDGERSPASPTTAATQVRATRQA